MTVAEERENFSDERQGMTDDVEAHGMTDAPSLDAPSLDHEGEGPDVEGHAFLDAPSLDAPSTD